MNRNMNMNMNRKEVNKISVQNGLKKAYLDARDGELFAVLETVDGDVQQNFNKDLIKVLVIKTLEGLKFRSKNPYVDYGYLRYFRTEDSLLALADLYTAGGENLLSIYSTVYAE